VTETKLHGNKRSEEKFPNGRAETLFISRIRGGFWQKTQFVHYGTGSSQGETQEYCGCNIAFIKNAFQEFLVHVKKNCNWNRSCIGIPFFKIVQMELTIIFLWEATYNSYTRRTRLPYKKSFIPSYVQLVKQSRQRKLEIVRQKRSRALDKVDIMVVCRQRPGGCSKINLSPATITVIRITISRHSKFNNWRIFGSDTYWHCQLSSQTLV